MPRDCRPWPAKNSRRTLASAAREVNWRTASIMSTRFVSVRSETSKPSVRRLSLTALASETGFFSGPTR